jgi:hypothetical protein
LTIKPEGGLVASVTIEGHKRRFLIDSGAALSIINQHSFLSFMLPTAPYRHGIISASGHRIKVYGQSTIPLNFSGNNYSQNIFVVDFEHPNFDGLLGFDFLIQKRAELLASSQTQLMPHGKVALRNANSANSDTYKQVGAVYEDRCIDGGDDPMDENLLFEMNADCIEL